MQEHYSHHVSTGIPERLIEEALARNLEVIEKGLRLVGKQGVNRSNILVYLPDAGRVDILARDKYGVPVVIGVKSGVADDSAFAQIVAYMSVLKQRGNTSPRGIIVAEEFAEKLKTVAKLCA